MRLTAKNVAVGTCVTGAGASIICQEWGRIILGFLYYFQIIDVGRKASSSSDLVIKRESGSHLEWMFNQAANEAATWLDPVLEAAGVGSLIAFPPSLQSFHLPELFSFCLALPFCSGHRWIDSEKYNERMWAFNTSVYCFIMFDFKKINARSYMTITLKSHTMLQCLTSWVTELKKERAGRDQYSIWDCVSFLKWVRRLLPWCERLLITTLSESQLCEQFVGYGEKIKTQCPCLK